MHSQHPPQWASEAGEDNYMPEIMTDCNYLFKKQFAQRAACAGCILLAPIHQAAICDKEAFHP